MDTIKKKLMQDLECPVCMEYMLPPITLCENGHNICSSCRPKLHHCPTCRSGLTIVRNRTAELLTDTLNLQCKYKESGCTEETTMGLIKRHEQKCTYGPLKCPFNQTSTKCSWIGPLADMKKHLQNTHKDTGMIGEILGGMESFCVALVVCEMKQYKWQQAIFTLNEVFFWYTQIIGELLYICIQYVGPKPRASKYKYISTIKSADNTESMSFSHVCLGYDINVDEIIRNQDCVAFPYNSVKKCSTEEDGLRIQMEICTVTQ